MHLNLRDAERKAPEFLVMPALLLRLCAPFIDGTVLSRSSRRLAARAARGARDLDDDCAEAG
ncbi:hypothetical protein [Sorangium sp. So ce1335]|uniref:hypothetical protein n=1 Tax=Sorangium sp. So ce1335 TaxID=3133335 RepID=UPI003F64512C